MKKYILLFTVCVLTATAYGSIRLNNLVSCINQKKVSEFADTTHVPYKLIEGDRSEKMDSSKIIFFETICNKSNG